MLLVIDNFDSFTYNLVQSLEQLGASTVVYRNNAITISEAQSLKPDRILISPGPCTPSKAGVTLSIVAAFAKQIPILGVCLGHQAIAQHFGGKIVRAKTLMHGKTSPIHHSKKGLFKGIPSPSKATRYHSLIVHRETLPACLKVTAQTESGTIMGFKHRNLPLWGVQFHPESHATENGLTLLNNFLQLT